MTSITAAERCGERFSATDHARGELVADACTGTTLKETPSNVRSRMKKTAAWCAVKDVTVSISDLSALWHRTSRLLMLLGTTCKWYFEVGEEFAGNGIISIAGG